jgi:hypothetical protein
MKPLRHTLIFGLFLGAVCGLRTGWAGHYRLDLTRVAAEDAAKRSREVEAVWLRKTYTNFTPEAILKAVWSSAPRHLQGLSAVQQATLKVRLREVLRYLDDPGVEEYYRLKTEGLHWTFAPGQRAAALLGRSPGVRPAKDTPGDPKKAVEAMWQRTHGDQSPWLPKITAVSLDSVLGGTARTNSPGALLSGRVKNGFTASYDSIAHGEWQGHR